MVLARYMGETDLLYPTLGFLIGLILWLYVLGELYFGRLARSTRRARASRCASASSGCG